MSTKTAGSKGEAIACAYLEGRGCELLEKNYRMGRYEIDLVMRDGGTLVFVEVKARTGQGAILGREAVNRTKQQHIIRAAQGYLQQHNAFDAPVRFDVAEVDLATGDVTHIPAAFTA
ncbi:MAG: YraN family protein [Clostridia bacterium]|nr:YraN family protein [Clostridia bacterium]